MRHFLFLLLLSFTITAGIQAQASLEWGDNIKGNKGKPFGILGVSESHIYVMAYNQSNGDVFLQLFDPEKLNLQEEIQLELDDKGPTLYYEANFLTENEQIVFFYSIYEKAIKSRTLFYVVYNNKGDLVGAETKLFSVPVKNKKSSGSFMMSQSANEKYILASVNAGALNGKKEGQKIFSKVFDSDGAVINEIESAYEKKVFYASEVFLGAALDNEGNIFILKGLEPKIKPSVMEDRSAYITNRDYQYKSLDLLVKRKGESELHSKAIIRDQENQYIYLQPEFFVKPDGIVFVTGCWGRLDKAPLSINKTLMKESGFFVSQFNNKGEETFQKFIRDDREMVQNFFNDWYRKFMRLELRNFYCKHMYFHPSGDFSVYYEHVYAQGMNKFLQFHNIFHLRYSASGELKSYETISKFQRDLFMSYFGSLHAVLYVMSQGRNRFNSYMLVANKEDSPVVIFNDHPKNAGKSSNFQKGLKRLDNFEQGIPVLIRVGEEGEEASDRIPLLKDNSDEVHLHTQLSFQEKDGTVLVFGSLRKQEKLGRIYLD